MPTANYLLGLILLLNLHSFSLFYRDKRKARKAHRRIAEKKLIRSTLFLGGVGAFLAMYSLRHKTQNKSFKLIIPLTAVFTISVIIAIIIIGY